MGTIAAQQLPTTRWGIIGAGSISSCFVSDLCLERDEATTRHIVQAIGSSSMEKGNEFARRHCPSQAPTIYDNYDGVYSDPDVDIVYIGTPHTLHLGVALAAINAGKHVLCEKPIAMNAKDSQAIIDAAKAKGVFLMEAVWTRFFPIAKELQRLLHDEKIIGSISAVHVDFSMVMPIANKPPESRLASRALGAGALLDIGIYSLTWASITLDPISKDHEVATSTLAASMVFFCPENPEKKVDEMTTMILQYPDIKAQAICCCSMLHKTPEVFCSIYGAKGSIFVGGVAASKPGYLTIRVDGENEKRLDFDVPGLGFHYEADAVAQDIRDGKTQSSVCSWEHTQTIMRRMDKAREVCGLSYPQDE